MIVTFCGHSDYIYSKEKTQKLKNVIENLIDKGATEFLLGGYGAFDLAAANILNDLRKTNKSFRTVLVIPYLNREYDMHLYDYSIYPPIEHIPLKFAISERNKWMVVKCHIVVSGVVRSYGGAAKTLAFSKKLDKQIIPI